MLMLIRHLTAILLLPFVVVVIVPRSLLRGYAGSLPWSDSHVWPRAAAGAIFFALGLGFFTWCVSLFVRIGRGTLAPWDPPRSFVATGPYRHVRNPMITGVLLMLVGEAIFWGSRALGVWAASFLAFNHLHFLLLEEPGLESRFGERYRRYKAHVPRWIPRLQPWLGD